MAEKICQYSKTCSVFGGNEDVNETPLHVYKNVFCKRGVQGWNNCKQFLSYKEQELTEKNESSN